MSCSLVPSCSLSEGFYSVDPVVSVNAVVLLSFRFVSAMTAWRWTLC